MKSTPYPRFAALLLIHTTLVGATEAVAAEPDEMTAAAIAARIHARVTNQGPMLPYTNGIPGSKAKFVMLPIPAGEFQMGSPAGTHHTRSDESPAHRVKVAAFWMGQCEVTWNEFNTFVSDDIARRQASPPPVSVQLEPPRTDAVTFPTIPYVNMDFGMGKNGYPAIAMTHFAASQYCQWLSAKTGHFYRLPTEAEWEYAARAGTTDTWYFGEDESKLADHAWFETNSDFSYHKVGGKGANPWGLHDMLGNVSEWVLDQYAAGFYQTCSERGVLESPWNRATQPFAHTIRGGSWRDGPAGVRCAARGQSTPDWQRDDPQLPKSRFWLRSCDFVGFRIVRPLAVPSVEEMRRYWQGGLE